MHAAVATLQMAARQSQLDGGLDQSKYSRIMTQLRQVADQLTAVDQRAGKQKADPVNLTEMLRDALAAASPAVAQNGVAMPEPEEAMVEGPANDLRDLVSSLFEYALTVGPKPIDLRTQIKQTSPQPRAMYATELVIQSPDVPDFLRRKLWDAVRIRRGEVSVISEPDRCRIEFMLPVERRLADQD
jgi:hypothetical protein